MAQHLLDEFPPVSKQEWLDKVVADLKGKPYEKLVRKSESGIPIAPVYTADDLPADVQHSYPGMDDLRRGLSPLGLLPRGWRICQEFSGPDLSALKAIAESFWNSDLAFHIVLDERLRHIHTPGMENQPYTSGRRLDTLSNATTTGTLGQEVWIEAGDAALQVLPELSHAIQTWRGGLDLDPYRYRREGKLLPETVNHAIGVVSREFAWRSELEDIHERGFWPITVSMRLLEQEGASPAQQVGFALAKANDLVARMQPFGISPAYAFSLINFEFPVGTDFFGEIAKFRAFRVLWANVTAAWGIEAGSLRPAYLRARPAASTVTVADAHVNLLRHTTQTMAAAIGGCNLVNLPAFNAHFTQENADTLSIAYHLQRVLMEEAFLHKVIDPAGGGYYIEQLTDAMAEKAWKVFQTVEATGGWLEFEAEGHLAEALAPLQQARTTAVRTGSRSLLGTNIYPNEGETIPGNREAIADDFSQSEIVQRLQGFGKAMFLSHPLPSSQHLSADFEALRLRMQDLERVSPGRRQACLLTFGDPVMRGARANFARNVLAAGGFSCMENPQPNDIEASGKVLKSLNPSVVVLCSSDADYFAQAEGWLSMLKQALPDTLIVLAGKPEGWERLKDFGVTEAIFAGMDRVSFLAGLLGNLETRREATL